MNGDGSRPFEAFDVSILAADGHLWLSAHSEQGSVYGVPRTSLDDAMTVGYATPDQWLTEAIGQARVEAFDEARHLGSSLTDLIFGVPEVATLFQQTRGVAGSRGAQVLVRILAAPQQLSAWPWELILDPQQPDRFLTRARDVHVVRAGRSRTYPIRHAPITLPLNLLLVLSSPLREGPTDTEAPFDLYEEKRALLGELQPLVDRGALRVEVEDRPSIERIRTRMVGQRRGFHIMHYLGHAQPSGLKLENRNGRGRLVSSADFSLLLQQLPDLRLAVFAGCETARAPAPLAGDVAVWPGELSTADYCVKDACPMVIGMQAVLPFGTERLLTRYFYQALTGGQAVAESLRLARLAIADDDQAGGKLLNWAVPCLFVGGSEPGPLVEPDARATAPPPRRRIGLRLGVRQGELRFISRLTELREAIDVLSAQSSARALMVIGLPGTGKTLFLDRVVEELDIGTAFLLASVDRLLEEADPLQFLCQRLSEVVSKTGRHPSSQGHDSSHGWWERLLEDLADTPLALALDDADLLKGDGEKAVALREALVELTERRGLTRLALAATEDLTSVTGDLAAGQLRTIRLQALSWPEVWQWIRRNLPVLTRLGESTLSAFYADIPRLEDWERLADAVASQSTTTSGDIAALVRRLGMLQGTTQSATAAPPPIFGAMATAPTEVDRSMRALRVAVAGPHTEGRGEEFARAITQYAAQHRVAGRVPGPGSTDAGSLLAELVPLESPFATGSSTDESVAHWLDAAKSADADVILLDFGADSPSPIYDDRLPALAATNRLIVAAGGNEGRPCYPAWYPDVIAVGALELDLKPTSYSVYFADDRKPDVYALKTVADTALAAMVSDSTAEGTSFAAMHAVAAAIVVWATDRRLAAREVRAILIETATPAKTAGRKTIRRLDADAALLRTRSQQLVDSLERGALGLHELLAATGMRPELALPILDDLVASGQLRQIGPQGDERFENPRALYLLTALPEASPGEARSVQLADIVERARALATRGRFNADELKAMWASGLDGRRIAALGVIQGAPQLGGVDIVVEAIRTPRSAFERDQALSAADAIIPSIADEVRSTIGQVIADDLAASAVPYSSADRRRAERVLASLEPTDAGGPPKQIRSKAPPATRAPRAARRAPNTSARKRPA